MNGIKNNRQGARSTSEYRNSVKQRYPAGTRIELKKLCNHEQGMPSGLRGTVIGTDDQPALLMAWDNGRTLSLLPGEDRFRALAPEEVQGEHDDKLEEEDMPCLKRAGYTA